MDFRPIVASPLKTMDPRIFDSEPMGLRAQLLEVPFDARFKYDPGLNTLFINFERYEVHSLETIEAIRRKVAEICAPLKQRSPRGRQLRGLRSRSRRRGRLGRPGERGVDRWYDGVTRYTTSAFLRAKLGDALSRRKLAPHIFESEEEALAALPKP
jgi:propionate CoA-transferase